MSEILYQRRMTSALMYLQDIGHGPKGKHVIHVLIVCVSVPTRVVVSEGNVVSYSILPFLK